MKAEINAEAARLKKLRDKLIEGILKIPKSYLNGHPEERTPHNANFRFDYIEGESLLLALKDENVEVATGSACSSKTLEPSHTLISCGLLHEEAHGSLLLTLGRFSEEKDVDKIIEVLPELNLKYKPITPEQLVFRFGNKLKIPIKTQKEALKLLKTSSKKGLSTNGKDPKGFAASAIYMAARSTKHRKTQIEVSDIAKITEVTLRTRLKDIKEVLN